MSLSDIWVLLAGLGLFLFGIYLMEDAIKALAGRSFKQFVRRYTSTTARAVLTGLSTTSLLQSSSAIMLMVLAFVGAGVMTLQNAVGVVLGANIGTTITAWIVAVFGFKISIESIALPIIALGGIGLIFSTEKPRLRSTSKLLLGFGLLFHGLDYMKGGVEQLTTLFDIELIAGVGMWLFVFAGVLLTALMQSSSATIAIVLAAISTELIEFRAGAAMVIGANVGTTVTVILGALGGIQIKKKVACVHLLFNVLTAVAALLLLSPLVWVIEVGLGWRQQVVLGIALFHTLFNLIGLVLFIPLISSVASLVDRLFPEPVHTFTHYIQNTPPEVSDAALTAFNKEILHQYKESRNFLVKLYELEKCPPLQHTTPSPADHAFTGSIGEFYLRLKQLHGEIFDYYARISAAELENEESKLLDHYLRSSRSIMNAAKNLKDIKSELDEFSLAESSFLGNAPAQFQSRLVEFILALDALFKEPEKNTTEISKTLNSTFIKVEEQDRLFIRESSEAIRRGALDDVKATSLLMANRLFTQSCRMILLSLRSLLLADISEEESSKRYVGTPRSANARISAGTDFDQL
ncbi:Na/Pi cotransporter family protein [Halalkalibaculum sp. DA384]|uniref:Na/Pi cotransporter family protein n=1 Tax=Halalkalibaculum sp. DA384 TaxID=3373606 RepID=UPI003753FE02